MKQDMTFEEAMASLEQIVQSLEKGDVPLEQALTQFQEGMTLSKFCQDTLNHAEKTLTQMMTEQGEPVIFDKNEEIE